MKKHIQANIKKVFGLMLFIGAFLFSFDLYAQSQTFNNNGTYTVPAGVTNVRVQVWGAGGGGGSRSDSNGAAGGGGGGAYSFSELAVTPGQTLNIVVGSGGSAGNAGGDSQVSLGGTALVLAKGGAGVAENNTTGADGGSEAQGIGNQKMNGGKGNDSGTNGGNGGAGANGGNGGNGATNATGANGGVGTAPGGGGGGARRAGFFGVQNRTGGAGGAGRVIIDATQYWGSGSRDIYPRGVSGHRAFLRSGTTKGTGTAYQYGNRGVHYVYAKVGETIALASSAIGANNGRIQLYNPNGTLVVNHTATSSSGTGGIPSRTAELAGPRYPGQAAGSDRYAPVTYSVTQEGVYMVQFTARGTNDLDNNAVLADANWTQGNNTHIAAWDVSVWTGSQWAKGRTYANVLALSSANYSATPENNKFYGLFYIQTKDGYTYRVNNNGMNGMFWMFWANNKGFLNTNGTALYRSLNNMGSASSIYDPNWQDDATNINHKIFYSLPATDMPETAPAALLNNAAYSTGNTATSSTPNYQVVSGNTWLKAGVAPLTVSNVELRGAEQTLDHITSMGGTISFDVAGVGDYTVTVESTNGSFPTRTFTGTTVSGRTEIPWDGKDGNNNPIPRGVYDIKITIVVRGGEVHFPYLDVEFNTNGFIIEQLDHTNLNNVLSDVLYWDDRDVANGSNGTASNPKINTHIGGGTGLSSNVNGHIFGVGATGALNMFGNEKALDTWTFVQSNPEVHTTTMYVKTADLAITEVSANQTELIPGQNIQLTVKVKNNGPDSADGAKFEFQLPAGIDPSGITFNANGCGTEAAAIVYNAATRTYTSTLNLPNGCEITYTVNATVTDDATAHIGQKSFTATILRPNDVIDPDATNMDPDVLPTNAFAECNNNGLGGNCNNINSLNIMVNPSCLEDILYYENFGTSVLPQNNGRVQWLNQPSKLGLASTGGVIRYEFSPGQNDPLYNSTLQFTHTPTGQNPVISAPVPYSHAHIPDGHYAVVAPGYMRDGYDDNDPIKTTSWFPGAAYPDYYDWTGDWDQGGIRDISEAVNGAAFLVRGSTSNVYGIQPFYQIDFQNAAKKIEADKIYSLQLYSYVTYHDVDYMFVDVVNKTSGLTYASIPLKADAADIPMENGSIKAGVSFGWVKLSASFSTSQMGLTNEEISIHIRGNRTTFGHTLLDDILFYENSEGANCPDPYMIDENLADCTEEVAGDAFDWSYTASTAPSNPLTRTISQPATDQGFVLDIYELDNSFNMEINGEKLASHELEFQSDGTSGINVRFVDGDRYETNTEEIWKMIGTADNPLIRIEISPSGNVKLKGSKVSGGPLFDLVMLPSAEASVGQTNIGSLNKVIWNTTGGSNANTVIISQSVISNTLIDGKGYGRKEIPCETYIITKDGDFNDVNADEYASVGETITYTFVIENGGGINVHDVVINDAMLSNNPIQLSEGVNMLGGVLTGDNNGNNILDIGETWIYTVDYTIKLSDIKNGGVYNRASVQGRNALNELQNEELSTDPTPYNDTWEGWDEDRPNHTFVPLVGRNYLITNPMIRQKTK